MFQPPSIPTEDLRAEKPKTEGGRKEPHKSEELSDEELERQRNALLQQLHDAAD